MIESSAINLPHVQAEIELLFQTYEQALMQNDLATLDRLFWQSPLAIRFGVSETLYGIDAIRNFREVRSTDNIQRTLHNTTITTFSEDLAITTTEFDRPGQSSGRQTQILARFADGWHIVSAHVSYGA